MDIVRQGITERKRRNRWLIIAAGAVAVVVVSVALAGLEPAAPAVDRDTVWIGTVERGSFERQVRGHGTLVPESLRWIQAQTTGRVDRIFAEPGQRVEADDVILKLINPEVERASVDAANALRRADAELESLRMTLVSTELDRRADAAAVKAEYTRATLQAEADRELFEKGLISDIQLRSSEAIAESLTTQLEIENQRMEMTADATRARLDAKLAEVEQQRALHELRAAQLDELAVRAGIAGVVQEVPVEIGQQVAAGTMLARVAEPTVLQAELRVPATRARDVRPGQAVKVDTRNGIVEGTVARVDPSVQEGSVMVEVRLDGSLPEGARPDMAVDGAIQIQLLTDVLLIGRPVQSQENATLGLYRLDADDKHAQRVSVRLGGSSVDTIEIVDGLKEGDRVILSDTSRWDDNDRIRLN
ncbi:MAG: HlyD family efflux transporter periplasmic adaptor subunit [Thermoanaerobaculales bacterium]|jgi:HlyD family secretion protein|nr:HlyD family efflux transporter periplasmic adaptor subunit [Thermoanaerobaculales bacterium]